MSGEIRASTLRNLDITVEKAVTELDMNMESVRKASREYFSDTDVQLFVEQLGTNSMYYRKIYQYSERTPSSSTEVRIFLGSRSCYTYTR